jgi:hypothetical protein
MKRLIIVMTGLLLSFATVAQPRQFKDLVGQWAIGGEQNKGAILNIIDSSSISLTYMGETRTISNVKIDFSKTPMWFDFSATDSSGVMQVKSLLQVVGDSIIKWQLFIDEERSPHFSATKGELLYLRKNPATTVVASN